MYAFSVYKTLLKNPFSYKKCKARILFNLEAAALGNYKFIQLSLSSWVALPSLCEHLTTCLKLCFFFPDSFEITAPSNGCLSAEPGQNVTLSCQLPNNWPMQQVMWEKVQPHQVDVLASCNLSQRTSYTSKYLRKTWSNCSQGSTQSVLFIPNATSADSGLYRCRSEASTGEQKTYVIRLIITDGE